MNVLQSSLPPVARPRKSLAWVLTLAIVGPAGCNADRGDKFSVYPVKGTVKLADGTPLTEGSIVFVPAPNDPTARQASGTLGSDGGYTLNSGVSGEGAAPGVYNIRIETAANGANVKGAKPKISPAYFDEDSSKLSRTVKAEPNTIDFKLEDRPQGNASGGRN